VVKTKKGMTLAPFSHSDRVVGVYGTTNRLALYVSDL